MDVNFTGAIAANVSLMQPSKTDYLPLLTQIITTLLTAVVALVSVYLAQYLGAKSEAKKREEEEKERLLESRKDAYQDFMEVFSSPLKQDINWAIDFNDLTRDHLRIALNAVEFGDELAIPVIRLKVSGVNYEIKSLSDLIKFIVKIRYTQDLSHADRIEIFKLLRIQAADRFSSSFLSVITPKDIRYSGKGAEDHNSDT